MSLQAYCFVASSSRVNWTPEKLRQIAELALPLLQLKEALMANPTLVRFLPSLRVFLLSSFVAEAKQKPRATTVMEEIAACEDDDDAALLWLSFRLGIDCCQKQWLPATNQILLLGHLKRAYSRGFDPLFADTFPLSILRILSNSIEALPANQVPAVLRVISHLLEPQRRLFSVLSLPRGDVLRQGAALCFFTAVFSRIRAAYSTLDALIREEAISADVGTSSRTAGTSQRELLECLQAFCAMEPFDVLGCEIDVMAWRVLEV